MPAATTAVWQVQEAKNHFSEVIERALREGPQTVTRHGKPVVRVVAVTGEDAELRARRQDTDSFMAFLLGAPRIEGGLPAIPRDSGPGRAPLFGED
ncbi:MAG: type II toxin-antitoxin system Phd/YefM family antitoxin [Pseudorhodoferax sp.]